MNKPIDILNHSNLLSLWQQFDRPKSRNGMNWILRWPYRAWPDNQEHLELHNFNQNNRLTLWNPSAELTQKLKNLGWTVAMEQIAMARLSQPEDTQNPIEGWKTIHEEQELQLFTEVASASFGYQIDFQSIYSASLNSHVQFWLHEQAKACGILFIENGVAGIHMLGVKSEARRLGIAKNLMLALHHRAYILGAQLITLQASPMGKPLYQKLGYVGDSSVITLAPPQIL